MIPIKDTIYSRDDSANQPEGITTSNAIVQDFKHIFDIYYKNTLLYVALVTDYIEDGEPRLFCGQIGEIDFIIDKDTCFVKFYDFMLDDWEPIHQLKMNKTNLFPLFTDNPIGHTTVVKESRARFVTHQKMFTEKDFKEFSLQRHRKTTENLEFNQLVTVGTDFVKKGEDGKDKDLIQAGQVGRILKVKSDGLVEVIFEFEPIWALVERVHDPLPLIFPNEPKKIITIHQDYLFPLYYENLNDDSFDFSKFLEFRKDEPNFLKKFDQNTYLDLPTTFTNKRSYDDSSDETDEDISD